jgi:adenine-specific DNA glycosylase
MTAAEVEVLDEAWRRLGFKSRTAMLKKAIADLLEAGRAT